MAIKADTGAVDSTAAPWSFSEDPDVRGTIKPNSPQVQNRISGKLRGSFDDGRVEMHLESLRATAPALLHEVLGEFQGVEVTDDNGNAVSLTSSLEHCALLVRAKAPGEEYGQDGGVVGERITAEIVEFSTELYKKRVTEAGDVEGN